MAFRFLVVFLSLVLAVSCLSVIDYPYNNYPREEIEEFNGSSYAVVSSNYYLAKIKCGGCIKKGRGLGFMDEYLILNFSTTPGAVLLNGQQIHPQITPPPEILAYQVPDITHLGEFDYDLSYSNFYSPDVPFFYPLSRLGYVVNASTQAHPPGCSDTSLVTVNFRIIQVGSRVLDCLDSVELSLLQTMRDGTLAVKGVRFRENEESYLPDVPSDDESINNYFGRYGERKPKAVVTASGFRKCHRLETIPDVQQFYSQPPCRFRRTPNAMKVSLFALAGFVGGVVTTLLCVYFGTSLKKGALRVGSATCCHSAEVWRKLRGGRGGIIRLSDDVKDNLGGGLERE